jgi:hypothetical protein
MWKLWEKLYIMGSEDWLILIGIALSIWQSLQPAIAYEI